MGKIVVSENITLDGVVEDPAGAEGFGRGGWVGRVGERGREEAAKVLVDELRLMIYPVVLGAGERLFGETSDQRPVRLLETRTVDDLAYLTYEVVGQAA